MGEQELIDEGAAETWRQAEESIREVGFLSPWIDRFVPHHRELNKAWVEYASELNKLGQRMWNSSGDVVSGKSTHDPIVICFCMLIRALENFQGAIIMAERGMTAQADILSRGIYETAFWIGYFNEDAAAATEAFMSDERQSQIGITKAFKKTATKELGEDLPQLGQMDQRIADLKSQGAKFQNIDDLAEKSGFLSHYPEYRRLSARSAHTSLNSLHRHLNRAEYGSYQGFVGGPDGDNVIRSIQSSCVPLSLSLAAFSTMIGGTFEDKRHAELLLKFGQMTITS